MARLTLWLAGLFPLLVYLWCAGPTFYWLDSGELVAAAWGLGIAHPPGHPLAALAGRLVAYLPVGTIALRVTVACALQAAAACALTAAIAYRLVAAVESGVERTAGDPRWPVHAAVLCTALSVGLSYAVWFQAVRAEVYALNLLLILAAVHQLLCWTANQDGRRLLLAAMFGGLGLCNHHFLVLLALPGAALYLLVQRRSLGSKQLVGVALAGCLGLTTLVYLPLRAEQAPRVDWGAPHTVERFGWVVSARAFQKAVPEASRQSAGQRGQAALFALFGGLTPLGVLVALGGLYLAARRRASRPAALLLLAVAAGNLLTPLLIGFDPFNPDAHGYLAVAVASIAPGIAVLASAAVEAARRVAGRAASVALTLPLVGLPVYQLCDNLPRADLHDHWAAEATARALVSGPPGALVVTSYYQSIFNAWALRATADYRPDLLVYHRNFVSQPGYAETISRRQPELAPLARAAKRARRLPLVALDRIAARRAVRVEYDLNVPPDLAARLVPAGLVERYRPGAPSRPGPLDRAAHRRRIVAWERSLDSAGGSRPSRESETRRAVVWVHYRLARYACRRALPGLARFHLSRARRWAPRSRAIAELERSCL